MEVLPGGALDDDGREAERRVVVVPLRAGFVLERRLPLHDVDEFRTVDPVPVVEAAARHPQQVQEFAQPRRVRDQVLHLNGVRELREFGDVLADVVIEGGGARAPPAA